ncbi:hypothetical protein AVEN_251828-1 [Araneus ventricosus]|uniref:Uncharacterized protein n=1 Tax=Araneus ventricosus TaxID=182803 RepID=A0A4Y2MNA2_ARAVE|nr:hypothetical protein AVEN_251828-1 [Araneus ventricosus]
MCGSCARAGVCVCAPYGHYVHNYPHPGKPLCSVFYGHIARGQDGLTEARTDRREVTMHFLPRIPILLTGNRLGSELGSIHWRQCVCVAGSNVVLLSDQYSK